jgi:multidrug efflux pump subunit AcrA (membrane-fusion protein)
MSNPLKPVDSPLPKAAPLPEPSLLAAPTSSLEAGPLDAGLVLREANSDEFLPSVRPWVHSASLVLLGSFAAAVALMAVWPYRVVVRGSGVVRPSGETSVINAPFAARVRQVLVQPNERVQTGKVLALLDPTDLKGKQRQLRQSQQALAQQSRALVNQGLATLQASELEVVKSRAKLRFAETEYRNFRQLSGTGAITINQLEEKEQSYKIALADLAKAKQAVTEQLSRNLSDQAQLERELATNKADLGQIDRDLAKTTLTAPLAGVLFSLKIRNPGQMVAAGEEVVRIAPSKAGLLVKVLVPSQDISNVEVNQRADLRISGCPYPDFGTLKAKVMSIAPEASLPSAAEGNVTTQPTPTTGGGYEVTLLPNGSMLRTKTRSCALLIGMDLNADITTNQETVLGFLLRKARLSTGV